MASFHRHVSHLRILDTVEDKNLCTLTHRAGVHYEPWERRVESAMVIQKADNASWEFCGHLLRLLLKRWAGPLEELRRSGFPSSMLSAGLLSLRKILRHSGWRIPSATSASSQAPGSKEGLS